MEKVIRNGEVAVLISQGFGAGWYSWNTKYPQLLFHPKLIEMVENNKQNDTEDEEIKEWLGLSDNDYIFTGGISDLKIEWVKQGTAFRIDEYDGAESLVLLDNHNIITA